MTVIRTGIHKMLVRMTNWEDPESDMGLRCLSRPFCKANSVRNFRAFTISRTFPSPISQVQRHITDISKSNITSSKACN